MTYNILHIFYKGLISFLLALNTEISQHQDPNKNFFVTCPRLLDAGLSGLVLLFSQYFFLSFFLPYLDERFLCQLWVDFKCQADSHNMVELRILRCKKLVDQRQLLSIHTTRVYGALLDLTTSEYQKANQRTSWSFGPSFSLNTKA